MIARWYAVHCNPRQEGMVNQGLKRRGYDTLFLWKKEVVRHGRMRRHVHRAYYPRYVFVSVLPDQGLYPVSKTEGVAGIVHSVDGPLDIPEWIIIEERKRGNEEGRVIETKERQMKRRLFERGESVRILGGAFVGFLATIELDKGSALSIWLHSAKGRVKAEVHPQGVEPAAPIGRRLPKNAA